MSTFSNTVDQSRPSVRGGGTRGRGHGRAKHFIPGRGGFNGRGRGGSHYDPGTHQTSYPLPEHFITYGEPATSFYFSHNTPTDQHFSSISSNPQADPFVELQPSHLYQPLPTFLPQAPQPIHSVQQRQYQLLPPSGPQTRNSFPSKPQQSRKSSHNHSRSHADIGRKSKYGSRASQGHYYPVWDHGHAAGMPTRHSYPGTAPLKTRGQYRKSDWDLLRPSTTCPGIEQQEHDPRAPVLVDKSRWNYSYGFGLPSHDEAASYDGFQQVNLGRNCDLLSPGNYDRTPSGCNSSSDQDTTGISYGHRDGSRHGWGFHPSSSSVRRQHTLNGDAPEFVPTATIRLPNSSPLTTDSDGASSRRDFSLTPEETEIAQFLARAGQSNSSKASTMSDLPVRTSCPEHEFVSGCGTDPFIGGLGLSGGLDRLTLDHHVGKQHGDEGFPDFAGDLGGDGSAGDGNYGTFGVYGRGEASTLVESDCKHYQYDAGPFVESSGACKGSAMTDGASESAEQFGGKHC